MKLFLKESLEQGSCALELNEMEKVSSLKVSLVSILKAMAMANCNLEQDAKDLRMSATSFLKVLNSMGVCMQELNAKDLNKLDSNSCNCSRVQELLPGAYAMFH